MELEMCDFSKVIHLVTMDKVIRGEAQVFPRISYVTLRLELHLLRSKLPSGN